MMNSQAARFFLYEKWFKSWKKAEKKGKIKRKKTSKKILFMRFYLEGRNATNKSCLFYAKFFEFEEFS